MGQGYKWNVPFIEGHSVLYRSIQDGSKQTVMMMMMMMMMMMIMIIIIIIYSWHRMLPCVILSSGFESSCIRIVLIVCIAFIQLLGYEWILQLMWNVSSYHVNVDTCHHGMARPHVADWKDGLQMWRVAANILNKQPTGGGRLVRFVEWPTTPYHKKTVFFLMKCLGIGRILLDDVGNRKWVLRFETWNVMSLYMTDWLKTVESEMAKYNLPVLAINTGCDRNNNN
jgi:hypothetical protein